MKPLILIIRRKTRVPTRYQTNRLWRSDWIKVAKITYADSAAVFETINGTGAFKSDAQFSKWIYESFGEGIYHINAWRKGHCGIISFFYVEVGPLGFIRMRKTKTLEQKENEENLKEIRHLKKRLAESDSEERAELEEEISDLKEECGINSEIISLNRSSTITNQYLKATKPLYKFHQYDSFVIKEKPEEDSSEKAPAPGIEDLY